MTLIVANALTDPRSMRKVDSRSRRRCWCGCKTRATHIGLANGLAMTRGCELFIRRWVRNPRDAVSLATRRGVNVQTP